jgi:recombination protein RecA
MARKKVLSNTNAGVTKDDSILNDILVDSLNKKLGDVAFILGKGDSPPETKEWLSTGSTILDTIISNDMDANGGIPVGKLVEISGEAASGKSLLSYMILKDCQDKGGIPVLIDTENAANEDFLRLIGLEFYPEGSLVYIQVDSIEGVFKAIEDIIRRIRENDKDKLCCIVWDSVAGTSTDAEIQGDYGDATVGLAARLIGQGLRKIIRFIGTQRVSLVFLNQIRQKIGVFFGDDTVTPGGKAIPFFAAVRVRLYSGGKVKAGKDVLGVGIRPKIVKNRMGPPHREADLKMYFNRGLIDEEGWLEVLLKFGEAKKISAQKSQIVNKDNGETYEVLNRNFVEWIRKPENKEAHAYCKNKVKESLIIEQDPLKRQEEITTEELDSDEVL